MSAVIGSVCTGYGGLDAAVRQVLGDGRLAWVADPDPHVSAFLEARVPGVANLGDIREVDWSTAERVDVLTAGFPCQDISAAGRRAGIREGTRSGLWFEVIRAIGALRPGLVLIENVAALRWRNGGMDIVLAELARAGYDCVWTSLRASDVGACHRRERVFILAWPQDGQLPMTANLALAASAQISRRYTVLPLTTPTEETEGVAWGQYAPAIRRWEAILDRAAPGPVEPGRGGRPRLAPRFVEWLMGLDEGAVTDLDLPRTAQLKILGNGVVPQQAEHAITLLLPHLPGLSSSSVLGQARAA